jgi:ABC-type cobalamin/Fe3+-siderophores transport system ATPase subunit
MVDRLTGKPLHLDISDLPMKKGIITNRNKFILGPSGSGKSFFTNHMVRQYPNAAHILISGGAGKVIFPETIKDCIVIPQSATFEMQDKIFAYKVVDGKAQSTEIKILATNDGKTYVVEAGLNTGDVIVAEGAALLRNGTSINTAQESKEGAL